MLWSDFSFYLRLNSSLFSGIDISYIYISAFSRLIVVITDNSSFKFNSVFFTKLYFSLLNFSLNSFLYYLICFYSLTVPKLPYLLLLLDCTQKVHLTYTIKMLKWLVLWIFYWIKYLFKPLTEHMRFTFQKSNFCVNAYCLRLEC